MVEPRFETPAFCSLHRAINDERLDKEDYRLLLRFLVAQIVRTPAFLFRNPSRWHEQAASQLEDTERNLRLRLEEVRATGVPLKQGPMPNSECFPLRVAEEPSSDGNVLVIKTQTVVGGAHGSLRCLLAQSPDRILKWREVETIHLKSLS